MENTDTVFEKKIRYSELWKNNKKYNKHIKKQNHSIFIGQNKDYKN